MGAGHTSMRYLMHRQQLQVREPRVMERDETEVLRLMSRILQEQTERPSLLGTGSREPSPYPAPPPRQPAPEQTEATAAARCV